MNRRCIIASVGLMLVVSSGCGDDDDAPPQPTATATASATGTATTTVAPTLTRTRAASPTRPPPTPSPTATAANTATGAATHTPIATPPRITYFGVARADDLVQTTELFDAQGRPIFERVQGQGMTLVLEAARGTLPLADLAFDPFGGLPGAQFIVSRPLGDGSLAVCDFSPPIIGGIPATTPLQFSDAPAVADAINDFGCRVNDGTGVPRIRFDDSSACTRDTTSEFAFVDDDSDGQFCLPIARAWAFPPGDTIVAARVQDELGHPSAPREIVVRVAGDVPFGCENGLGERVFTPARPGGGLYTSIQPGDGSLEPWVVDPIQLCAGPDLGDGVHPLALRADAVLGIPLTDGTTLCVRLFARGSDGSLDCDGGTPTDVRVSQDAEGTTRIALDTGLGAPAGAGAASIQVPIALRQMPAGFAPGDCRAVSDFSLEFNGALTTTTGVAEVTDPGGGPAVAMLSRMGVNFDCRTWRDGADGTFVLPFPAVNVPAGDVSIALVLAE